MPIYSDIVNGLQKTVLPSQIAGCPGGRIMLGGEELHTFSSLFDKYWRYFHAGNHWTWNGGTGTPSGASILDGTAATGQCVAFARALRLLGTTRRPFGLALSDKVVEDPFSKGRYEGRYKFGFVSQHVSPLGGHLVAGLPANVIKPPVNPDMFEPLTALPATHQRSTYYLWSDHKVVPFQGRYYDPSYGRIWNSLPSMAAYHMKSDRPTIKRNLNKATGGTEVCEFTEAEDAGGGSVWFRDFSLPEMAFSVGCQGPYAALPGTAAA